MLKSVLVGEIVNSDVGENRELASLSGGFRDCSTDNVITCKRMRNEANIENPFQKAKTEQEFRVNYSLFQPFDYFDDLLWPLCHIPDCDSTYC